MAGGFAATSVVVFLLGIVVGQWIEEGKLLKKNEEPLVRIPVEPLGKGTGPAPGSPAKEEMTFYDTLAKAPAAEPAKPIKPVEKAAKPAVKEIKAAAKVGPSEPPEKPAEKPGAAKAGSLPEAQKETQAQKTAETEAAEAGTGARVWTVQVNAYPEERDAKGLVKKLKGRGYDAYVVPTTVKGNTWYRVRVGRLETKEEARELQETLKTKESFTKAITVSR